MPGAEPHAVLTRTLWLLVAAPLAGFVWHLVAGLTARARAREAPRGGIAGMLAIGGGAGSAAVHVALLARQTPGAFFAESLTSGVHVGRFDAPLALALDPLAAAAIALACLTALIAAVVLSAVPEPGGWRAWAWLELALAGAVLSFAADDPATMACGWSLAAIAGAWLAGWVDPEAAVRSGTRSAAALLAFLLGTALLAWGLRGTWHGDDYVPGPDLPGRIHFAQGMLASPAALDALRDRISALGWGTGPELVPSVLTLWLVAAWAMSGAPLRTPAPAPLVSVAYGATTAWLGPFLLARGAALFGMAPKVHVLVACVGGAMAVMACAQALGHRNAHPAGAWAPFAAASPGVLAWIALGASDGPQTDALHAIAPVAGAVVGGVLATASLLLFAVWPGAALVPADAESVSARSPIGAWLESTSERLGALLLSNERWVIEATGRGVVLLVAVGSWAATRIERDMLDPVGDAAAARVLRAVRRLFGLALFVAVLGSPQRAFAAPAWATASGGRVAISLPNGDAGPLVLAPVSPGDFEGTFVVRNAGTESITVSRLALRGDEEDVRSPARVSVRFAEGAATQATIAPGASKNAVVTWIPDRDAHVRQAFGHVVITSSDEVAGEVAIGFRADMPSGLGWLGAHALSFLLFWPFVSALLFVAVGRLAGRSPRGAQSFTFEFGLGSAAVELAMALWAFGRFAADAGRAFGNDGFQLIERTVWARSAGAEWYVGVDGTSIALVLLVALVAFAVACLGRPETRDGEHTLGTALLVTGAIGVLVALDLVLFFSAWCVVWLALVILVGAWGGPRSASASAKLTVYALVGSACLLLAFVALSRASGPAFLVDGTRVAHTLSIPELSRTSFAGDGTILGLPFVRAAWGLLLVAVVMATPLVPLHGWLPDVLEESPPGAGILVAGAVLPLGPYLLIRVGLGAVPEGARWAAASVAALAAFAALWASLCAYVQTDLRRFAAYAAVSSGAMSLYGIASLTPEGIAGGGLLLFAHGLSSALLLGVAAAVTRRLRGADRRAGRGMGPGALAGLGHEAPLLAGLAALALATSAAVPGLVGGWGVLLVMLGGFVRYPLLAFFLAAALVVSAAAHLRFARAILLSPPARGPLENEALASFGGHLPDATFAELSALLPLALLAVCLGLWPSPIVSSIAVAAHDISVAVDPTGADVNGGR